MKIERLENWKDVAQLPSVYSKERWIFRGVSASNHALIPKAGRPSVSTQLLMEIFPEHEQASRDLEYKKRLAYEKYAIEQFQKAGRPFLQFEPRSDLEWLAVAQHHNLPTRLLDWTLSPLIAAYFAVKRKPELEPLIWKSTGKGQAVAQIRFKTSRRMMPGAIYVARAPDEIVNSDKYNPFTGSRDRPVRLYSPPHISPRVTVQKAVLTVHHDPWRPWAPRSLVKYEIPGEKFREIRKALDIAGINESTMFPDLDGIGRHLGSLIDTW
jgi:hypothetical protein